MGGAIAGDARPGEDGPRTETELAPSEGASLGHDQRVLAADPGVGAARPEALDRAIDQAGVGGPDVVVAEPPRFDLSCFAALEHHVGSSEQVAHALLSR